MTGAHWKKEFEKRAAAHWTDTRTEELLRGKELPVSPDRAPALLRSIDLLHRDASMPPRQRRKFFQLNHMLRLLRPPLEELIARGEPLQVLDAGCGRSYVTMALAWCFEHVFDHPAHILGVDRNTDLIERCRTNAAFADLGDTLRHAAADLAEVDLAETWRSAFDEELQLDIVISLHACDTATDDAIALGLEQEARLIAVAPCCQAELARGWAELAEQGATGAFAPVWNTPHLRRETAATMTDTFRMLLLETAGYETRTVEFVASSHTPKNTLIRAMRRGEPPDRDALDAYVELRRQTGGVGIRLEEEFSAMMDGSLRDP
jgi:SAM-dependent methyltransferase